MRHVEKKCRPADPPKPRPPIPDLPEEEDHSWWGCTDVVRAPYVAPAHQVQEIPPDPLPEYISADQARRWGIRIRMPWEPKEK